MTKQDRVFEIAKAIAPVFGQKGIELQLDLLKNGNSPKECTIEGKSIPEAYAITIKNWAIAIAKQFEPSVSSMVGPK